mmetsp:Transcript_22405/g.43953  ORF Transcript_22405/g.43953 Transcript_22405/m.43953 type:complete len:189 (-) Transcript_22405:239-805(-)
MQQINAQACQFSGVAQQDAFIIDEVNLFERLGLNTFVALSTNFYNAVYDDNDAPWFKDIFATSDKEEAIINQYSFLVQRMGGPPLFSQRKGHPALIGRHIPFRMTHAGAKRWIFHMEKALDTTPGIDEDSKRRMMLFFRHTAYFLVAGVAKAREHQKKAAAEQQGKSQEASPQPSEAESETVREDLST